ncbi:pilus assembly protein PilM [Sporosarcina oncorhynchi]|uniref:Pilus assembly protein PilM n=1 Tax=Sporosarcina oncorhynchi TaxID=3056444 RepID=A0ABZ0L8X3_9BACL|nr:pilus assembly protein PilM [Sporosarcina sp. T2O-4]WOV88727.1 pilus assembly protein PilM [Sporosarcina sp. T2O-4]
MFAKLGKKTPISVELNDYIFRLLIKDPSAQGDYSIYESAIEEGLIHNGEILNELALFEHIKSTLGEWGMKKLPVNFFVPDPFVLMRPIDVPTDLRSGSLLGFIQMEVGHSIHLPFDNPVLDIHDANSDDGKAVLYAAPAQDVRRIASLYDDASLEPEIADVRMLANARFLLQSGVLVQGKTVLVADWIHNGVSIGIFGGDELEFLRFQEIQAPLADWKVESETDQLVTFSYIGDEMDYKNQLIDQVLEIGRIINFYQFSLHKGEKTVDEIVLMGDNPELRYIQEQLQEAQGQAITVIDNSFVNRSYPGLFGRHAALIGLSLKGEE